MSWSGLAELDNRLDSVMAGWRGHPVADGLAYGASALGDHGLIWFLIGLARGRRPGRRRAVAVWAISYTGVISPLVNAGLKSVVGRGRPEPREDDPASIRTPRSASFPSGHTLAAWCAATLLADGDPLGPLYYGVAGAISVSRVHLRAHHGSDVLAGAALGIALGRLGRRLSTLRKGRATVSRNVGRPAGVGDEVSRTRFAVTYDYRCPFARNVHEHLVEGVRGGADWDLEYLPFSLTQSHIEHGERPVWDDTERASDLIAIEAGLVVREIDPDRFLGVHLALFTARHDEAKDLRDEAVIRQILAGQGVDDNEVFEAIADGWPRQAFRKAHEEAVAERQVFGVPTFISGETAAFVRIMTRPQGNAEVARATIDNVLLLLSSHPEVNEFKHTSTSN